MSLLIYSIHLLQQHAISLTKSLSLSLSLSFFLSLPPSLSSSLPSFLSVSFPDGLLDPSCFECSGVVSMPPLRVAFNPRNFSPATVGSVLLWRKHRILQYVRLCISRSFLFSFYNLGNIWIVILVFIVNFISF